MDLLIWSFFCKILRRLWLVNIITLICTLPMLPWGHVWTTPTYSSTLSPTWQPLRGRTQIASPGYCVLRVYRSSIAQLRTTHYKYLYCIVRTPVKLVLYFILYFRSYSNVKIYLLLFFNTSHYNIIYLHIIHGKANKSTSILIQMPFLFWIFSYLSKIYT